ncbi:Dynein light chain Tctex-type 1 [Pteropus alecto]|uniref:Dynein light chain Tctex-type 1 n=1 Tax=Pteropus alecto TaxID=9402 RepID=L5KHH8_PTEAL|nr:Dynein light chain Tctex-type 1 [Pteropus alecto]
MDKRLALDNKMYARVTPATYEEHLLSLHLADHFFSLDDAGVTLLSQPCPSMEKTLGRATAALCSTSFVVDEVSNIVKEAIESAIGGNAYQHSKVNQWTTNVVEQTLSQLTKLGKPFKYIVTCVIMQKNGAGLHTASSCFWDSSTDGSCTVRWENKTMYCIVSTFGLSI